MQAKSIISQPSYPRRIDYLNRGQQDNFFVNTGTPRLR